MIEIAKRAEKIRGVPVNLMVWFLNGSFFLWAGLENAARMDELHFAMLLQHVLLPPSPPPSSPSPHSLTQHLQQPTSMSVLDEAKDSPGTSISQHLGAFSSPFRAGVLPDRRCCSAQDEEAVLCELQHPLGAGRGVGGREEVWADDRGRTFFLITICKALSPRSRSREMKRDEGR